MTKREHDAATQCDFGAGCAADEAIDYRAARGRVTGDDYVARRAAYMAARNTRYNVLLDGFLPTLGAGSRYRNIAVWRAHNGVPLLESSL